MSDIDKKVLTGVAKLDAAIARMGHAKNRDEHQQLLSALTPVAARHIDHISVAFAVEGFPRFNIVWALMGTKTDAAVRLFCQAIMDRDQYVRWAASEALARCDSPDAADALVTALKDRSTLVKAVAVTSMKRLRPKSVARQLTKIVQSKHLWAHSPGIVEDAEIAIARIENGG